MTDYLIRCRNEAKEEKDRSNSKGKKISYMKVMLDLWNKQFSSLCLTAKNLQSKLYSIEITPDKNKDKKEPKKPRGRPKGSTKKLQENSNLTDTSGQNLTKTQQSYNIPSVILPHLKRYHKLSYNHSVKPLVSEICYNCGCMVYGRISEGHKFSIQTDTYPVEGRYEVQPNVPCITKGGKVTSCRHCKDGPQDFFPCGDDNGKVYVPDVLKSLQNCYEKTQVSLCGVFSHVLRKMNQLKSSWEHRYGETNVLTKLDRHYTGMYGYLVGKKSEGDSHWCAERITKALTWLRKNNPLHKDLLSKVETLYRYQPSDTCLPSGSDIFKINT